MDSLKVKKMDLYDASSPEPCRDEKQKKAVGISHHDEPSRKSTVRRRKKHTRTLVSSSECDSSCSLSKEGCPRCNSEGKVTTRLFDEASTTTEPPVEGTAGHVQTWMEPVRSTSLYEEEQDEEICMKGMQRCLYRTARMIRLLCFVLTPFLLLLLCLGPTAYNQLPPIAKQLSLMAFPALRLWATPAIPGRKRPCHFSQTEQQPNIFDHLFSFQTLSSSQTNEAEGKQQLVLPSAAELKTEFAQLTPGHISAPQMLVDHTQEFQKEILKVADGIYVAIGFGLANCVILQGPEGLVVVDTMESIETMQEVWKAWLEYQKQQQQQQPQQHPENQRVKGILYTHFHTDHTFGAAAIYEEGVTEVHASWLTREEMEKVMILTGGSTYRRSMRQFGGYIQSNDFINAGIGPELKYNKSSRIGTVLPTHIMHKPGKMVKIAGLEMELIHAPGESKDHMIIWLQGSRVLIGGDNIYKSLPNIYAIRGTETRNCTDWVASLDLMRSLQADILVLGHTRPILGKENIYSTLTAYRDAIQFLHDQTIRLMNGGLHLNDIVHSIHLPRHLAEHPYLRPLYGTVPWAIRAIFTHYMGWFSGDPEDLSRLSAAEWAEELQDLAGGFQSLMMKSLQALRDHRYEWALETATAANTLHPDNDIAKQLRVTALRALAAEQTAATGRNWYLTAALEAEGKAVLKLGDFQKKQALQKLSLQQIFAVMSVRVNPEAAETVESVILFKFFLVPQHTSLDTTELHEEEHCVHFRKGVVYTRNTCEKKPNVVVETTAETWLKIITREISAVAAVATGDMKVTGSLVLFARSMGAVELEAD